MRPSSRSDLTCPNRLCVRAGLTPAIGSSNIKIRGSVIRARAISKSFRCPPDIVPANSSRMCDRLKRSNSASARDSISLSCDDQIGVNSDLIKFSPLWCNAPNFKLSITVILESALVNWNVRTIPCLARLCEATPTMSFPKSSIEPESMESNAVRRLKNVVLPAPFGPIKAVITPDSISRCFTSTAFSPPNDLDTLFTTSAGLFLDTPGVGE